MLYRFREGNAMLNSFVIPLMIIGSLQAASPAVQTQAQVANNTNTISTSPVLLSYYSGRVAPGPDHGPDPHNEIHGGPNYLPDPYGYTTGNGSDPYGGTTSNGSDPYGGQFPGAPIPGDKYGGNVPD